MDIYQCAHHEKVDSMAKKSEVTSKGVASKAAKIMKDPKASKAMKSVAASALTQSPDKKKKK